MAYERKTYASEHGNYKLDPAKLFSIVADIFTYVDCATTRASEDNQKDLNPLTSFIGKGRKMILNTEVVNEPGILTSFNLAELVLSAENDRLTLKVHAHPSVAIPSEDLHEIGNEYKLKK